MTDSEERAWDKVSELEDKIAELEKENAELNKIIPGLIELKNSAAQQGFEILLKELAELERENTELKEEMRAKQVVLNDFKSRVETVTDRFNKKSSQLTKAKGMIKVFVDYEKANAIILNYNEFLKQAEDFIKE